MRRILWLAKGLGRGGAEQLLLGAAPYIDPQRFEVEVAYLLPWKDALVPDFEARGLTVHCLDNRHPLDPRWTGRLRALVRSREFDIVHTHMPYVAAGARIAVASNVTFVHTEHNVWDRYRTPTRWANLATYGRNARVIAVSQAVADSIRVPSWASRRPPPVEVVRHGADLAAIRRGEEARSHARRALGLDDDEVVVGSVANFTAKKDQRTLLAAVALLRDRGRRLRLVLVGSGPLEHELRAFATELRLRDVLFTGMRTDVYDLLPGFDVYALSSRYEGLPISLLEAMATGLACVATRVGGIPEVIVQGRNGLLVEAGDASAFATALERLVTDESLRHAIADRAADRAAEFDLRGATLRTQEIYDRSLESNGSRSPA